MAHLRYRAEIFQKLQAAGVLLGACLLATVTVMATPSHFIFSQSPSAQLQLGGSAPLTSPRAGVWVFGGCQLPSCYSPAPWMKLSHCAKLSAGTLLRRVRHLWGWPRDFSVWNTWSLYRAEAFCSSRGAWSLSWLLTRPSQLLSSVPKGTGQCPLFLAVLFWHFSNPLVCCVFSRLSQINFSVIFSVFLGSEMRLYIIPPAFFFLLLCQVTTSIFGVSGCAELLSSCAFSYHHSMDKSAWQNQNNR